MMPATKTHKKNLNRLWTKPDRTDATERNAVLRKIAEQESRVRRAAAAVWLPDGFSGGASGLRSSQGSVSRNLQVMRPRLP